MSEKYHVSVRSTPLPLPLQCFIHAYIVTQHAGVSNRYEVIIPGMYKNIFPYDGRIFKNLMASEKGFLIFFERNPDMSRGLRWHTKEASRCEGDVGSPTHKLYEFIESGNLHKYPHKNNYHMIKGPNCNAFIQWIIDQVPEANLSLPWNAWGKSFKGYV